MRMVPELPKTFEWDSSNKEKNLHKHNVSHKECEEVFFTKPLVLLKDTNHSLTEDRYYAFGSTYQSRKIIIVFTLRNGNKSSIRVISARPMSRKEKYFYEKIKKRSTI